eukprot:4667825-Lingulodinium_polyedra.AAC.1
MGGNNDGATCQPNGRANYWAGKQTNKRADGTENEQTGVRNHRQTRNATAGWQTINLRNTCYGARTDRPA